MSGPLQGLKIIEMSAIGPVPLAATLLADMGADVIRIVRSEDVDASFPDRLEKRFDFLARSRSELAVDLKTEAGRETVLQLVRHADALIEGFRPGVMERLGLAPDACHAVNPRLIYARMTGFGQTGPLSMRAGHDLNFISLSGALHAIGPKDGAPCPPLVLVGDFGGGGMFLAFGLMAALWEAQRSGHGQVIDAAMFEGAAYLMGIFQTLTQQGLWRDQRGANSLDGAAPYYTCYETADGRYVAVSAIEKQFYGELIRLLGLTEQSLPGQHDRDKWPELRAQIATVFKTRTRDEWAAHFAGTDACVTPVLTINEVATHEQAVSRASYLQHDGVVQPAPHPRFSRTPAVSSAPAEQRISDVDEVLARWRG